MFTSKWIPHSVSYIQKGSKFLCWISFVKGKILTKGHICIYAQPINTENSAGGGGEGRGRVRPRMGQELGRGPQRGGK